MRVINLISVSQAYAELQRLWHYLKLELNAGRKQVLKAMSYEEALTDQQRKYYHGYILTTIAQQAVVDGRKYQMRTWKDHYRALFLGDEIVEVTDVMTGTIRKEVRRISSESLGVKGYNELIEKVTADASTEFGVVFDASFEEWQKADEAS